MANLTVDEAILWFAGNGVGDSMVPLMNSQRALQDLDLEAQSREMHQGIIDQHMGRVDTKIEADPCGHYPASEQGLNAIEVEAAQSVVGNGDDFEVNLTKPYFDDTFFAFPTVPKVNSPYSQGQEY